MATSQFISVRETAQVLAITEKKVMDLIGSGKLQAYRIADKFLRLKRADVLNLRNEGNVEKEHHQIPYTSTERIADFFYFHNFYILSSVLILVLLYIIFYT
jgi:excisionase family DNA binding protein